MPPAGEITENTDEDALSNRRPIDFIDSPALPSIPDLSPLGGRIVDATSLLHGSHSTFARRLVYCVHRLSPPPEADVSRSLMNEAGKGTRSREFTSASEVLVS